LEIIDSYLDGMSTVDISKEMGIPISRVREIVKSKGVLRSRAEAIRLARNQGKLSSRRGVKRKPFTEQHKKRMSEAKKGSGRGVTKKPNGYIEYTAGENKGRSVHVVLMEKNIGRRIFANECVHHINGNREDNRIENLQLMTRREHAKLHAKENYKNRKIDKRGRFK